MRCGRWTALRQGVPLSKLLGGTRDGDSGGRFDWDSADDGRRQMEKVSLEVAAGYQRIKLKCKPGWDEADVYEGSRRSFRTL